MDFKGTEQEKKDMVKSSDHDLLQLHNIRSPPFPIPNSSQRVSQNPHGVGARYRECLKNHAARTGGNILDGCGEFMPAGEEGTPESLKCAACNCHRSFHRREPELSDEVGFATMVRPLQLPQPLPSPTSSVKQSNGQWINSFPLMVPTVKMGFGSGGATESSSEEMNLKCGADPACLVLSKKRFRTKFTREQKEKMMEFAEKVGWRVPREDDAEGRRFCVEAGVKRHVLKVWMHNNKVAKKE